MRINNDGTIDKSEEILVSGASLVFFDVRILKRRLEDSDIQALLTNNGFREVDITDGYNNKIFSSHSNDKNKHMVIRHGSSVDFPILSVTDSNDRERQIVPKVTFYMNIYDRNIVVFQPVIVFDKNSVTQFRDSTLIDFSLNTNNLLEIIHYIKTKEKDGYNYMKHELEKLRTSFKSAVNDRDVFNDTVNYEDDNESVGIQIWDIENLGVPDDEMVYGSGLEKRFELEISALINYKNEHFSRNNMWKQQSANSVSENTGRHTDVLNDHCILQSDRVCIEISQVNHPTLRPISAARLCEFGYDSTSLFLWGYIQIIKKVFSVCQNKSSKLRDRVITLLDNPEQTDAAAESSRITKETTDLYKELEIHNRIKNSCIEIRHRDFITQGMEATGLDAIHMDMKDIFSQITGGISVAISARTSKSNSETAGILEAIRDLNKIQSETSTNLALITVLFTIPGVCTLAEYIASLSDVWNSGYGKTAILIICAACYAVTIFLYVRHRKK